MFNFLLNIVSDNRKSDFTVSIFDNIQNLAEENIGALIWEIFSFVCFIVGFVVIILLPMKLIGKIFDKNNEEKQQNKSQKNNDVENENDTNSESD